MSAFDEYHKDDIVASIKSFVCYKKEQTSNIQINDLVKEVMDAVSYGMVNSIYNIENGIDE